MRSTQALANLPLTVTWALSRHLGQKGLEMVFQRVMSLANHYHDDRLFVSPCIPETILNHACTVQHVGESCLCNYPSVT